MEVFGSELRENWLDNNYVHAGYNFEEVYREEEFVLYKALDSKNHFELFRRRSNPKLRNYLPNKSQWGSYAWTVGSIEHAKRKINEINNK